MSGTDGRTITTSDSNKPSNSAALPVRFGGCAGYFTPSVASTPAANSAVLLVSPWGFEDMSVRKFYREICDALSLRGIANLRFDFPGTGDSADIEDGQESIENWLVSIAHAAAELKRLSGVEDIILAGHGLGGTLALLAASRIEDIKGLAILAPVISGRIYIREVALWWKMIAADLGLGPEFTETGSVTIAGFEMPDKIAAEIRKLKEPALRLPHPMEVLAVTRPSRDGDETLAAALEADGSKVTRLAYEGHDALVTNPIRSKVPKEIVTGIADWARRISSESKTKNQPAKAETVLEGEGYRETGIRFGNHQGLCGTLCEPLGERRGASVVIVGTSYDRASGWSRIGVKTARRLAYQGIASLRFDAAGIADSPPQPGDPEQVLYNESHNRDVREALDELTRRIPGPAVLGGRCSGGYHAFQVALDAPTCAGIAVINSYAFIWEPGKDIDEALTAVARPLSDYSQRALNPETFRRLLRGDIDVKSAALNIISKVWERVTAKLSPLLGNLTAGNRLKAQVRAAFGKLEAEKKSIVLLYGDNDPGLDQFKMVFGSDRAGLNAYPNAVFHSLGKVDHNITSADAQDAMISEIAALALKVG